MANSHERRQLRRLLLRMGQAPLSDLNTSTEGKAHKDSTPQDSAEEANCTGFRTKSLRSTLEKSKSRSADRHDPVNKTTCRRRTGNRGYTMVGLLCSKCAPNMDRRVIRSACEKSVSFHTRGIW